ncbi:MAG: hypothetical protein RLZZ224_283, partial [Verrucomicrobiota bacterium]
MIIEPWRSQQKGFPMKKESILRFFITNRRLSSVHRLLSCHQPSFSRRGHSQHVRDVGGGEFSHALTIAEHIGPMIFGEVFGEP